MKADEIQQSRRQITLSVGDSALTMYLQDEALIFEIQNHKKSSSFRLDLTPQKLKENQYLSFIFYQPAYLLEYLSETPMELIITDQGLISFKVNVMNRPRKIELITNQVTTAEKVAEKDKNVNTLKIIQGLQNQLNSTKQEMKEMKKQMNFLKEELKQIKDLMKQSTMKMRYAKIQEDTRVESSEVVEICGQVESLEDSMQWSYAKEDTKGRFEKVETIEKIQSRGSSIRKSYAKIEEDTKVESVEKIKTLERVESLSIEEVKEHFWVDPNNQHYRLFEVYKNRVKKIEGYAYQTVIGRQFAFNEVFIFRVKQVNVAQNDIMYGVGSNRIRGRDNSYCEVGNSVLYLAVNSGQIWPGCFLLNTGGVQNGQVIQIMIDTKIWKITWSKNGFLLAVSSIPEKIRNQPLFPVIYMRSIGDQIQFV